MEIRFGIACLLYYVGEPDDTKTLAGLGERIIFEGSYAGIERSAL
ncbi:MAG TPA: hypothetical protein VEZ14_05770 [Dehalococcoidia bacterium]|nr:hypothetical protein [Dehalococcoidia bacterium]